MDPIGSFLLGGGGGALVLFLLRGWLSERLKQSIQHEYSQKLESYKAELNGRLQAVDHDYQMRQLKTSLFFDHQRSAFAALTTKIAEVNSAWERLYDPEEGGLTERVPLDAYRDLRAIYHQHQLFLDRDGVAAMEIIFETYQGSFPVHNGGEIMHRDPNLVFDAARYLQPRIAELFRMKIGVSNDDTALRQIILFAAIKLINKYHFEDIALPVKGALKLEDWDAPAEAVRKASENREELLMVLRRFQSHLMNERNAFYEAFSRLEQCLEILGRPAPV